MYARAWDIWVPNTFHRKCSLCRALASKLRRVVPRAQGALRIAVCAAYRELDDALGLTDLAGAALSKCRRGKNTRNLLSGLLRQSVFGRLAGGT